MVRHEELIVRAVVDDVPEAGVARVRERREDGRRARGLVDLVNGAARSADPGEAAEEARRRDVDVAVGVVGHAEDAAERRSRPRRVRIARHVEVHVRRRGVRRREVVHDHHLASAEARAGGHVRGRGHDCDRTDEARVVGMLELGLAETALTRLDDTPGADLGRSERSGRQRKGHRRPREGRTKHHWITPDRLVLP
jgi:hypothetical protein